jgi:hypothetical protein
MTSLTSLDSAAEFSVNSGTMIPVLDSTGVSDVVEVEATLAVKGA